MSSASRFRATPISWASAATSSAQDFAPDTRLSRYSPPTGRRLFALHRETWHRGNRPATPASDCTHSRRTLRKRDDATAAGSSGLRRVPGSVFDPVALGAPRDRYKRNDATFLILVTRPLSWIATKAETGVIQARPPRVPTSRDRPSKAVTHLPHENTGALENRESVRLP